MQKFVRQKSKFGKFARRICSEQIFEQKKIIWAIFRQAIEGSKFDEKFVKFPPHRPKTPQKCHQNNVLSGNRPLSHRCLSVGSGVAIYDHRSVAYTDTRFEPNILGRGCTAPSLDGARAGPLANTLFGAKHGGHCHRQSASTFPSFRRQMLRNS